MNQRRVTGWFRAGLVFLIALSVISKIDALMTRTRRCPLPARATIQARRLRPVDSITNTGHADAHALGDLAHGQPLLPVQPENVANLQHRSLRLATVGTPPLSLVWLRH